MSNPLVIVAKNGMVQEVYSPKPCRTEIEIIDLDFNGSNEDAEYDALERLNEVRQNLYKLY